MAVQIASGVFTQLKACDEPQTIHSISRSHLFKLDMELVICES